MPIRKEKQRALELLHILGLNPEYPLDRIARAEALARWLENKPIDPHRPAPPEKGGDE